VRALRAVRPTEGDESGALDRSEEAEARMPASLATAMQGGELVPSPRARAARRHGGGGDSPPRARARA
jgi:hypothetical protein